MRSAAIDEVNIIFSQVMTKYHDFTSDCVDDDTNNPEDGNNNSTIETIIQ